MKFVRRQEFDNLGRLTSTTNVIYPATVRLARRSFAYLLIRSLSIRVYIYIQRLTASTSSVRRRLAVALTLATTAICPSNYLSTSAND